MLARLKFNERLPASRQMRCRACPYQAVRAATYTLRPCEGIYVKQQQQQHEASHGIGVDASAHESHQGGVETAGFTHQEDARGRQGRSDAVGLVCS